MKYSCQRSVYYGISPKGGPKENERILIAIAVDYPFREATVVSARQKGK